MESGFHVHLRPQAHGTVVTVSGELDVASSGALERELDDLGDVSLVVVDLSTLEFIDSTGLGVLVTAHQRAQQRGHRFALVGADGQVSRLLALSGLEDELLVRDSLEQLLGSG